MNERSDPGQRLKAKGMLGKGLKVTFMSLDFHLAGSLFKFLKDFGSPGWILLVNLWK